jgi:hypothetical protein
VTEQLLRTLADRAEIQDLLARYCRGIDRCDLDLVRSAYHPDATERHGPYQGNSHEIMAEIVPMLEATYAAAQHHLTNMLIEIDGDHARGETYFLAFQRQDHADGSSTFEQYGGRYLDRFERRDGRWGITERLVLMDWTRVGPTGPEWAGTATFPGSGVRDQDPSSAFLTQGVHA